MLDQVAHVKTIPASIVCLLVGSAIGLLVGYRYHDRHVMNEAVRQMVDGIESADGAHAAEATRVVEFIQAGESSNAMRMLSRPIADYYQQYAVRPDTDRRQRLRAMIEQLASTNQVVSDAIHNTNQ
jgi:hypothetical protein